MLDRLRRAAPAVLLLSACAAPVDPGEDGAGGGAPGVPEAIIVDREPSEDEAIGEALEAFEPLTSPCARGCMEMHYGPCKKFLDVCKGKPDNTPIIWGNVDGNCYWAVRLACGALLELTLCFRACKENGQ